MHLTKRKVKGQNLLFEQVLLFGMGVLIFIVCFSAFSIYQSFFSTVSSNDQLNQVKDLIVSDLIKLSQKDYEVNSSIELDIPARIDGKPYIIELSNNVLNITLQGMDIISKTGVFFNLGQLDGITFSGRAISISESILIYKKANEIIIL